MGEINSGNDYISIIAQFNQVDRNDLQSIISQMIAGEESAWLELSGFLLQRLQDNRLGTIQVKKILSNLDVDTVKDLKDKKVFVGFESDERRRFFEYVLGEKFTSDWVELYHSLLKSLEGAVLDAADPRSLEELKYMLFNQQVDSAKKLARYQEVLRTFLSRDALQQHDYDQLIVRAGTIQQEIIKMQNEFSGYDK